MEETADAVYTDKRNWGGLVFDPFPDNLHNRKQVQNASRSICGIMFRLCPDANVRHSIIYSFRYYHQVHADLTMKIHA